MRSGCTHTGNDECGRHGQRVRDWRGITHYKQYQNAKTMKKKRNVMCTICTKDADVCTNCNFGCEICMEYNYDEDKINRSKVEHMRNSITHGNIKVKYIDDETNHNETIF